MWVKCSVKQLLIKVVAIGICKTRQNTYEVVGSINGEIEGGVVLKNANKKEDAIGLIEAFEQAILKGESVFNIEKH